MRFSIPKKEDNLQEVIDSVIQEMQTVNSDSDEFAKMNEQLERLYEIRNKSRKSKVNPDTLASIIGNLLGIMTIVHFEKLNVITSKALPFVLKPKL